MHRNGTDRSAASEARNWNATLAASRPGRGHRRLAQDKFAPANAVLGQLANKIGSPVGAAQSGPSGRYFRLATNLHDPRIQCILVHKRGH